MTATTTEPGRDLLDALDATAHQVAAEVNAGRLSPTVALAQLASAAAPVLRHLESEAIRRHQAHGAEATA